MQNLQIELKLCNAIAHREGRLKEETKSDSHKAKANAKRKNGKKRGKFKLPEP